jgi:hypothetical protein
MGEGFGLSFASWSIVKNYKSGCFFVRNPGDGKRRIGNISNPYVFRGSLSRSSDSKYLGSAYQKNSQKSTDGQKYYSEDGW